jgi:anti-anti-sigma factor
LQREDGRALKSTGMPDLKIDPRREGSVATLALAGEFDLAGIEQFESAISAVEAEDPDVIVVDLTDIRFMDSSGLRALVMADRRARKAERRLAIVPGPRTVRRVFEITQLDEALDLIENASALER